MKKSLFFIATLCCVTLGGVAAEDFMSNRFVSNMLEIAKEEAGLLPSTKEVKECTAFDVLDSLEETGQFITKVTSRHYLEAVNSAQVALESAIAKLLQDGTIQTALIFEHKNNPCFPLCINPADADCGINLRVRLNSIMNCLCEGAALYLIYPSYTMSDLTSLQQHNFYSHINSFPEQIVDAGVPVALPNAIVGSTYIVTSFEDQSFVISISTPDDVKNESDPWSIEISPLEKMSNIQRVSSLLTYLMSVEFD